IVALVVSRESRRRGTGGRLIAEAEKNLIQRGITRVAVTARFEREKAHQFYEKLGYARTGFRFAKNLRSYVAAAAVFVINGIVCEKDTRTDRRNDSGR